MLNPEAVAEFVYLVSPRVGPETGPDMGGGRSMVDLLPINETTLLALEREFISGEPRTNSRPIALFEIDTREADNVIDRDSLTGSETPLQKRLVLDFDELRQAGLVERVGSFEAMIFGPQLEDGRHTLIFMEDNDGAVDTQVIAFAVELNRCDANFDGQITGADVNLVRQAISRHVPAVFGAQASPFDARDANWDGRINRTDVAICALEAKADT